MAEQDWKHVAVVASWLLGWAYFLAWTISFFPQAILNAQRKTTRGLLPDFPVLNVYGFTCYCLSTGLFLFSPAIRAQYAARHPISPEPTVKINDLAFGALAVAMSIVTYSQFWPRLWGWEHKEGVRRHVNTITLGLIWGSLLALGICSLIVLAKGTPGDGNGWAWIDVIYATQYIKLLLTIFKYLPQVIANFRRKSTIGWSITQQLLDFAGGIGSLLQLVIDSSMQGDWSGLTGNPLKLGLANITLVFDIIFILQHFVLFGPVEENGENEEQREVQKNLITGQPRDERQPLLASSSSSA